MLRTDGNWTDVLLVVVLLDDDVDGVAEGDDEAAKVEMDGTDTDAPPDGVRSIVKAPGAAVVVVVVPFIVAVVVGVAAEVGDDAGGGIPCIFSSIR